MRGFLKIVYVLFLNLLVHFVLPETVARRNPSWKFLARCEGKSSRSNRGLILLALSRRIDSISFALASSSPLPTYFGFCPPGIQVCLSFSFLFLGLSTSLFPSSEFASSSKTSLFSETSKLEKNEDWEKTGDRTWQCPSSWPCLKWARVNQEYEIQVQERRLSIFRQSDSILVLITSRSASGSRIWGEVSIRMLILRMIKKKMIR